MKKVKPVYVHKASTIDTYYSMISCSKWLKLLVGNNKSYQPYLASLIRVDFFAGSEERISIKQMGEQFGFKKEHITKWIQEMYADIFQLNHTNPELFKSQGIRHELYFKGIGTSASLTIWLKSTPRVYEKLNFFFLDAKLGSRSYWVRDLHHDLDEGKHLITVFLKWGLCNVYRELLVQRGVFYGHLGLMDIYNKEDYEIDNELKFFYKD